MFKIENFVIGSTDKDMRTSHEGESSDLTHEHTRSERKGTNRRGAKKRQRFLKIILEVGERETRGEWRIM